MISRFLNTICLVTILLIPYSTFSRSSQIELADSLRIAGFYDEAITEYRRYLFFAPDDIEGSYAHSRVAYCYAYLGNFETALKAADLAIETASTDSITDHRRIERAIINLTFSQYEPARLDLKTAYHYTNYADTRKRAITHLLLTDVLAHDWIRANRTYQTAAVELGIQSDSLKQLLIKARQLDYKSPTTAMLLSSIIPGLGQAYCGHWLEGLNALLLNSLNCYLTINNLINERYVTGTLVFFLLYQRYYSGNRHHAYDTAVKENERKDALFEKAALDLIQSEEF